MNAFRAPFAMVVVVAASVSGIAVGQESNKLLPGTSGYLLVAERGGGIEAIELPSLQKRRVRPVVGNDADWPTIQGLSGPDAEGRIVYIEDHLHVADEKDTRHLLKTIRIDGTGDRELFRRPGAATWMPDRSEKGRIGSVNLSRVGGRVAVQTDIDYLPDELDPDVLVCAIEIWNIETNKSAKFSKKAILGPLAWFPDGKRLAYVKLVERDARARTLVREAAIAERRRPVASATAVYILDVDAGTESFLHLGRTVMISQDGRFIIIYKDERECIRVDMETGVSSRVTWSGGVGGPPVAYPAKDIVLDSTMSTKPAPKRSGFFASLDPPVRSVTYRLARLNAEEFQPIATVEYDGATSFGQIGEIRGK